jgi:hypothetical protein
VQAFLPKDKRYDMRITLYTSYTEPLIRALLPGQTGEASLCVFIEEQVRGSIKSMEIVAFQAGSLSCRITSYVANDFDLFAKIFTA